MHPNFIHVMTNQPYIMRIITITLLLFLSSLSFSVFSQTFDNYDNEIKRVQLILRGGLNVTNLKKVTPGESGKEWTKAGYNVGVMIDTYIDNGIYIQTGALLTTKGAKIKSAPLSDGTKSKLTLNTRYIQMPLYFVYKIPIASGNDRINIAFGPYFAFGVGGHLKGGSLGKADAFGNSGVCHTFSWGFASEVQYETPKFFFFLGTDVGFNPVFKKTDATQNFRTSIRNFGFNLGVGYKI